MDGTTANPESQRATEMELDSSITGDVSGASLDDALHLVELSEPERRRFLKKRSGLCHPQVVVSFCRRAAGLLRMDLPLAKRMVDAACSVAEALGDPVSSARAERARAQLHHIEADYQAAYDRYARSVSYYEEANEDVQAAITRSCALHVLALLGRFELADEWAERSRELFDRMGDRVRQARLDANVAVVLHRRHDFEEALRLSLRAFERLRAQGTSQDVAVTLRNMLVCHTGLRNVAMAVDVYERARAFADRHRFPRLVLEADYNIAYVHQMKGEHEEAIRLYEKTRRRFREWGDPFHDAVCDLDQSEAYLDLGELNEAAALARRAEKGLERLGVGLECGRASIHRAIVAGNQGEYTRAEERLDRAQAVLTASCDPVWPRLSEFYRALILDKAGETERALSVAGAAREASQNDPKVVRRALFDGLVALLHTRSSGSDEAQEAMSRSLMHLVAVAGVPKMPSPGRLLGLAETREQFSVAS